MPSEALAVAPPSLPWQLLHRQPLLLAGLPRTGTTWIATALAKTPGIRFLYEPMNQTARLSALSKGCVARYLPADAEDPSYAAFWREQLSPRTLFGTRRWLLSRTSSRLHARLPVPARLLVKEVSCTLALEWIEAHLGMQVVITTRHPCGFVASCLRLFERGQGTRFLEIYLDQPMLMETYFAGMRDWLEGLQENLVTRLAAIYGMTHRVLADQMPRHPDWLLVFHEDFCSRPEEEFRRLCEHVGIDYGREIASYIEQTSQQTRGDLYSVHRVSRNEPDKWKNELTPAQIEAVASVISRFDLPIYRDFA